MFLIKNKTMKKNWLIILLIFLLTANAGLITTYLITNGRQKAESSKNKYYKNYRGNPHKKQGRFEAHIADQLGLDNNQIEKMRVFSDDFHEQKNLLENNIFDIRNRYFNELSAANADSNKLTILIDSLGVLHASMMKLDHEHYKNIKSICTVQQAIKFDSLGRMHMNKIKEEKCLNERRRHGNSGN